MNAIRRKARRNTKHQITKNKNQRKFKFEYLKFEIRSEIPTVNQKQYTTNSMRSDAPLVAYRPLCLRPEALNRGGWVAQRHTEKCSARTLRFKPYTLYLIPYTFCLIPHTLYLIPFALYLTPFASYLIPSTHRSSFLKKLHFFPTAPCHPRRLQY